MAKRFSTLRDTKKGSQSYMEKRRGRREIELTRRGRGESKVERAIYSVINSLNALHISRNLERFIATQRREEGRGRQRCPEESESKQRKRYSQ